MGLESKGHEMGHVRNQTLNFKAGLCEKSLGWANGRGTLVTQLANGSYRRPVTLLGLV
jgi:hypothetical protein